MQQITPISHKVITVNLKPIVESKNKDDFKFEYSVNDFENNDRVFGIMFKFEAIRKNEFQCKVTYETLFQCSEPITVDFLNSHFTNINAPAIAFPFLRSFIAFMVLNAGYKPFILPSINFTKYESADKK